MPRKAEPKEEVVEAAPQMAFLTDDLGREDLNRMRDAINELIARCA